MANTDTKTIPDGWRETTLFDVATWINGLAFREIDFSKQGVPVIKISELKNGVTEQTGRTNANFDPKYRLKKRDMLFSWSGSPETSIDVFWYGLNDGWLNQHIFKVLPKDVVESDFLYYVLKNYKDIFIHRAKQKQTTGLGHVTVSDLKELTCFLPSLPEQRAIAAVLSSLDDKIELLREENKTLEAIAQAMFKEWFVNFNFPNAEGKPYKSSGGKMAESELGEIPEGWRVGRFTDIASILGGGTPKTDIPKYWNGDIPFFTPKDAGDSAYCMDTEKKITKEGFDNCNSRMYLKNTVFITARGTVGKCALSSCDMAMNQSCYALVGKDVSNLLVYLAAKDLLPTFLKVATGGVFDAITTETFSSLEMVVPPKNKVTDFTDIIDPIFEKILNNSLSVQKLSAVRDTLLPKLMKGEMRVNL